MKILLVIVALLAVSACSHSKYKSRGMDPAKMWADMDVNNDGEVSKSEFDAAHEKYFKKMDANSDGKITKEEKKAFFKSQMKDCKKGGCKLDK